MKKRSPYKIGLGRPFLDRAGLIFTLFILITLIFGGTAVYAEYKTGQIREKIVKPVQKFVSEVAKSFEEKDSPKNLTDPNILISTSSATIKVETKTNVKVETNTGSTNTGSIPKRTNTTTITTYPTPAPIQYQGKSYEQSLQELDAWSKQKQQENQQWFQQQSQQSEAAAKSWYDQKVQESQQQLEQWKKEHGF